MKISNKTTLQAMLNLKKSVDSNIVFQKKNILMKNSCDSSKIYRRPSAVFYPKKAREIQQILLSANKYKIPITTRGSGSSTTGASVPIENSWVINMKNFNSVKIDALNKMATCGVGAVIYDIQKKAIAKGLMYPPDPSSNKFATLGGSIATNAGGLSGAKYGVTSDYILKIKAFTGDGKKITLGAKLKKFASSYRIKDILVGSEGTLAVIYKATLKLIPNAKYRKTALLCFEEEKEAISISNKINKNLLNPAFFEFLDKNTIICLKNYFPKFNSLINKNINSCLIIEFDGEKQVIDEQFSKLSKIVPKKNIHPISNNKNYVSNEQIWDIRRSSSQSMFYLGKNKINEDLVVPLQNQYKLLKKSQKIAQKYNLKTATFGHIGDGNLHVHFMYNSKPDELKKAVNDLMYAVVKLKGAITGEHGIGIAKSPYLKLQHKHHEIAIMQKIKKIFDPNNILNPDKIFTPKDIWTMPKTEQILAWEKNR